MYRMKTTNIVSTFFLFICCCFIIKNKHFFNCYMYLVFLPITGNLNHTTLFIPGYGTRDAIFALHSIIAKSLSKGKRLYCCFVDYVKAFDSVIHYILWQKMLKYGISGNLLNLIMSMYSKLKTCVKLNGEFSEFFSSNVGLMQGESLSPFLN